MIAGFASRRWKGTAMTVFRTARARRRFVSSSGMTLVVFAVASVYIARSTAKYSGLLLPVAAAQTRHGADAPAEFTTAPEAEFGGRPFDDAHLDRLPGVRNRARPQPPRPLSEADVDEGLEARLDRMRERQAMHEERKGKQERDVPLYDHDPPREPQPAIGQELLQE